MKKFHSSLLLLSTAALVMLSACGETTNSSAANSGTEQSDTTAATSSEAAYPVVIKKKTLPYLEEKVKFNLDSYISVEMSDGSISYDYEVSCSKSGLTIEGHKIKSDDVGTYTIVITAGSLSSKVTVEVLSNEQIKLIDFLSPLEEDPNNFTVDLYADGEYIRTALHNSKYAVSYDKDNPAKLTTDGDPASTVYAYLKDNNGYSGYLTKEGNNIKPVFKPGIIKNLNYYYMMYGMTLDVADSGYAFRNGKDVLALGPEFTENLLAFGCSLPVTYMYDGVEYGDTYLIDLSDTGMDGNPDEATLICTLDIEGESEPYEFVTLKLHDVGSSSLPYMETAITSDAYIPETISGSEITTAFAAIDTAGNYTLTAEIFSIDEDADELTKATPSSIPDDPACNLFGSSDTVITQKVTSDGIYYEMKQKAISQQGTGYALATDYSLSAAGAVWNSANKGYTTDLDDTGAFPAATEIQGCTNVFSLATVKQLTAGAVTGASVDTTNWTSKKVDATNHTVTFQGDVGDNDGVNADNLLFKDMFNMLGSTDYGTLSNAGTTWTKAQDSTTGSKFALSYASDYYSFVVNTATNEIDATVLVYCPFSDLSGYFAIRFRIGSIGTTTYNFSSIQNGVASVGLLAA